MSDIRELLPLYALGILDAEEAQRVDDAIARDPDLARELDAHMATAEVLVDAVAPVAPAPATLARLLASAGGGRFERFAGRLGTFFDVSLERAREFLGLIERPDSWDGQGGGIALVHFQGGAAFATADCGFIRLEPGAVFPSHTHVGDETTIILQGSVRDEVTGSVLHPGDEYVQRAGSSHQLVCEGEVACIFAARAIDGIEIGGAPARPSKP